MPGQLALLPPVGVDDDDSTWVIDEPTKAVGRRGLARARAALAEAQARIDHPEAA